MSGLAGIWYRDRRAADAASVSRMLEYQAHRGPDGRAVWRDAELAMGAVSTHVVPDSRAEPVWDAFGRACSFDGRIDNRDEVAAALASAGLLAGSMADAELVLGACIAWGEDAPARLLGDFAFAFWDPSARTLICARDILGIRQLVYRVDGARVAWASEIQALVQPPFDQPPPDEAVVGEYLTSILTTTTGTLFRDIHRLAPATVLVATPQAIRVREYWRIDPAREVRYGTDAEYDDHYRSLLRASVEVRMRSTTGIGILLSGGIDSSLVTGAAAGTVGTGRLHTYSLSCPGDASDERDFIEAVVSRWELQDRATILADPSIDPYAGDVERYKDVPNYPNGARSEALFEIARRNNVRLILTGLGGDEWFTGHQAHYGDWCATGRLLHALREIRRDVASTAIGGWKSALWNAARPLMPSLALSLGRRVVGHSVVPGWIRRPFAARVALEDRLYSMPRRFGFPTRAQDEMFREATTPFGTHGLEIFDRTVARFGLEAAHPLQDRRLVEFGLALPEVQRWTDGRPKAIVRRAAADLMPQVVSRRVGSPDYPNAFRRALDQVSARERLARPSDLFDSWVDRSALLAAYDRSMAGDGTGDWAIWMATAIRLWADAVFEGRTAEAHQAA